MSNFQQLVSEEIRRLARKEVKASVAPLLKTIADLKQIIKEQRKELKELTAAISKQQVSAVEGTGNTTVKEEAPAEKQIRLTAARIRSCREKLGLSRKIFADLIGTTFVSVANWESGKTIPRLAQKKKIVAIRDMGKRELVKLMAEKKVSEKVDVPAEESAPAAEIPAAPAAEAPAAEAPAAEAPAAEAPAAPVTNS